MSPRLGPKTQVDEQVSAAAKEYGVEKEAALERAARKHGLITVREPSPYGIGSDHSYFLDLAYASDDSQSPPPPIVGDVSAAHKRLQAVGERRDLTTTVTAGGNFVPTGAPAYVGDHFAAAARAAATMANVLPFEPLPETGMVLKTPRMTTGTSTAVMATENSAVSETDIVESMIASPVATVSGQQDLSQQLFDRSDPAIVDIVLATDLGRSLGANFDQQVLVGTGANGQTFGLAAVVGITSNAYTDASPTQAEAFPVIAKTYSDVSTAVGAPATVILMHPRRLAWFLNWKDTATGMQSNLQWPASVTQVAAIPSSEGAATNQDSVFVLRADELPIFASPPQFRVKFDTTGSGNLIVRITAFQYLATLFNRRPEAIGRSTGTGWAGVTFA